MKTKKIWGLGALFCLLSFCLMAEEENVDLLKNGKLALITASSTFPDPPGSNSPYQILEERPQAHWETNEELEGAWIMVKWNEPQRIKELWIINKAAPYDFLLDPYMRTANYFVPKKVKFIFSDGTDFDVTLRLSEYYQIITLPQQVVTGSLKIVIEQVWESSGKSNTGLCKLKVFSKPSSAVLKVNTFEMYDIQQDKFVQSAKIEIVNPGKKITEAKLHLLDNGTEIGVIELDEIPSHSVSTHQIWIPVVSKESNITFRVKQSEGALLAEQNILVKPYQKNYFDGGTFGILSTCHNDLGWLNTPDITADYRSTEIILPAMDLLKKNPEFKYTMESIEYLKEFLDRNPEQKNEISQLMHQKRFVFGASYVQNLQVQVGQEKLIRQFYLGRRWLLENFPKCDSRFYMNTDVPGFTYQLPQILRKSGIDYMIQGRLPWGFYNWQGLDGTTIPVFAFRYASPYGLMNPINNTGWLKFLNEREYYYKPCQMPKLMIYDFNGDYLPPCPDLIPFVNKQNLIMEKFAGVWNDQFKNDPQKQINPPKIKFVEPECALKEVFSVCPNIETLKGDWPMSWAYYDEPGHREGLLMGRKGHNQLLKAESLFAWLDLLNSSANYPKNKFKQGWMANCWPDHGWGGNRGIATDSIYVESYRKSLQIGNELSELAGKELFKLIPPFEKDQLLVLVYNTVGWERTDIVSCKINFPITWNGLEIRDEDGDIIPFEFIAFHPEIQTAEVAFLVKNIPSFGFKTYYVNAAKSFPKNAVIHEDSIENEFLKVSFGPGGIFSLYDKINKVEILKTDKFYGGEVIQMTAPDPAWESFAHVNMNDFDKTSLHEFKTVRAEESPIRFIIEKEAKMKRCTLKERFILNKHSSELIVEADILNWSGEKERELRIVFPMEMDMSFCASYEVPFGVVEKGKDEIEYSILPDNYESQFSEWHARKNLPYREAINWVDISTGNYKGHGCLFASNITLHLFRDETAEPVDYPVVQHVLLSSRKSLAWNPECWFTQAGSHNYRMALYPHQGNWRFAYKKGLAFNSPLTAWCGKVRTNKRTTPSVLPVSESLVSLSPSNIITSALKRAEDETGIFLRFYEAEGRYTKAIINGFQKFSKIYLTDMLEYNQQEIQAKKDGSLEIFVKPWEIVNLKFIK